MTAWTVALLAGLAAALLGTQTSGQERRPIATFVQGSGEARVGLQPGMTDVLGYGPSALAVARDGAIYVLDTINRQLHMVSARQRIRISYPIEGVRWPRDLVMVNGELFVWDDEIVSVGKHIEGRFQPAARRTNLRESGTQAGTAVLQQFQDTGFVSVPSPVRSRREGGSAASDASPRSFVDYAGRTWSYRVRFDGGSAVLEIERDSADPVRIRIGSRGPRAVSSASIIGIDADSRIFMLVEQFSVATGMLDVRQLVARASHAGVIERYFRAPPRESGHAPVRSYAVDMGGRVFALLVTGDGADVVELAGEAQLPPDPLSEIQEDRDIADRREAGRGAARSAEPIARDEILRRADAYATSNWELSEANYQGDRESACIPDDGKKWLRPRRLEGKINQVVVGVPYNWGGKDSLENFLKKILSGAPAGNVCTCRRADYDYCVIQGAAGVDCSGLVSRVWGLAPMGTVDLAAVGRPKHKLEELRPGDILNRPGNHVRVFVSVVQDPGGTKIRAYEASLQCQGVCVRNFSLNDFDGYRLYAPPFLDD